jgi:lysylphosphatidylglycerol synthetase-like protein (DUF2156 family)
MPFFAVCVGFALLLLGVGGYAMTDRVSWTALIPAFFGLPVSLLGLAALRPVWRKHTMHAATALAILGLLGGAAGVPKVLTLMAGNDVARPGVAISQAITAVLCLLFVAIAVKSFIDARRNKDSQPSA